MNYLTDPCEDRKVTTVLTPVHMKEPLQDATLYPTGVSSKILLFDHSLEKPKGEASIPNWKFVREYL